MRTFRENRAFTLIELIVVIVVVGVLAGLAVPRFSNTIEKSRIAEAINILATLRDAQEVYKLENSAYTATVTNLDVTIPASKNFMAPETTAGNPLAKIRRNADGYDYTLTIDIDGTVKCTLGVAPADICTRLGCPSGVCN